MEMIYCPGCASGLHDSGACPVCGALRTGQQAQAVQRNPFKLIAWCVLWAVVFWLGSLFLSGALAGASDPGHAAVLGRQFDESLGGPLLLLSIGLSIVLTVRGALPGTAKTFPPTP